MKKQRTLRSVLSLLCCLAMLMAWLPVLPAAAAQSDKAIFEEDFEQYAANSTFDYGSTYVASNVASGGAVSTMVVGAGNGKYLRMAAQNAGLSDGKVARNRFRTVEKFGGAYTLEYDYCQLSDVGGHLDVYLRYGGYLRVRSTAEGGVEIYVHSNAAVAGVMQSKKLTGFTLALYILFEYDFHC